MRQLVLLLLLPVFVANAQSTRVLFLGNSYTQANNLPNTFRLLALSNGDTVITDANTPGGHTLQGHSTNSVSLSKIAQGNWDYVVLQEQSQIPSFPQSQVSTDCYPYARQLDSMIYLANPCTETLFYMTWGRKYGDATNCAGWPPVCTFDGMQNQLRFSYLQMGINNHAGVIPAGEAWRKSWYNDSTINLWSGDNSHPSLEGTYLTACTFYAGIFNKSPIGLSYSAGLSPSVALHLQTMAHQTVFDSLSTWQVHIDHPQIDFSATQQSGTTYQLNCSGTNYNSMTLLVDGNLYNDSTLTYTFANSGLNTVYVIASNSCFTDTLEFTFNVDNSTNLFEKDGLENNSIFPNPVEDQINFKYAISNFDYVIYDIQGRIIASQKNCTIINVKELESGYYFLTIDWIKIFPFIKK